MYSMMFISYNLKCFFSSLAISFPFLNLSILLFPHPEMTDMVNGVNFKQTNKQTILNLESHRPRASGRTPPPPLRGIYNMYRVEVHPFPLSKPPVSKKSGVAIKSYCPWRSLSANILKIFEFQFFSQTHRLLYGKPSLALFI